MNKVIDRKNVVMIKNDSRIAIDVLTSIRQGGIYLHTDYLKEKVDKVQRCIDFMKTFYEEKLTMGENQICPILSLQENNGDWYCICKKEECALWCEDKQKCAFKLLAVKKS